MDDDVGARKLATQCLFNLIGHLMGLHQRQMVVHFQMQLNKTRRARLPGT